MIIFWNLFLTLQFFTIIISQKIPYLNNTQKTIPDPLLGIPYGDCRTIASELTLKFSNKEIKKINEGFVASQTLNCLNLSGNQITEISPGSFKFLPNLYYLNLARNLISPQSLISLNGHSKLKTLILDENSTDKKHCNLTIQRSYFPNLRYLYLRRNFICKIPVKMEKHFPKLTHLYLTQNNIGNDDTFLTNIPTTLTHIYLEGNSVKKFNTTLFKKIQTLSLDDNEIQVVCNTYCHEFSLSLTAASNLTFLSLSRNRIFDIEPDSFDDTINLLNLNLSSNKIEIIRRGTFKSLVKLEKLSISHNILNTIPNFSSLCNLQELYLNDNKFDLIPSGEFRKLFMLKILSLNNNLIKNIETESLANLMFLEKLDLSNNKLSHLPRKWLTASERLQILNLRGNHFSDFENLSLTNVPSLKILILQENPIEYLNTKSVIDLPKNLSIHLGK